jgi:hypothetical protein
MTLLMPRAIRRSFNSCYVKFIANRRHTSSARLG